MPDSFSGGGGAGTSAAGGAGGDTSGDIKVIQLTRNPQGRGHIVMAPLKEVLEDCHHGIKLGPVRIAIKMKQWTYKSYGELDSKKILKKLSSVLAGWIEIEWHSEIA